MFGDPVRNEKSWDKKPLGLLLKDIESGKSPKCESRPAEHGEWGVLKLSSVTSCDFKAQENKALPPNVTPHVNYEVKAKDLLFSRKNTFELVAACAYVYETPTKLLLPDLIFRLVIKDENQINSVFLWKLLTFPSQRKSIQSLAAGAAGSMPNISKANLRQAEVIAPPLDDQKRFVSCVSRIEKIKHRYQSSLSDLEDLYNALSQKAFSGELDLSGIKLQEEEVEPSSFEKLQKSIEVFDRLIPEPIRRMNRIMDNMIPPSIQRLQQPFKALNPLSDNLQKALQFNEQFSQKSLGPFSYLELSDFKDPKARSKILEHWFNEWLEDSHADELKLYRFWARAQRSLVEKDLEEYQFSVEDYDTVKKLLFQAIDNDLIHQTTDYLLLEDKSEAGNRVVLAKG